VREAFAELGIDAEVIGCNVASGVPEQPVKSAEDDEILQGAINRACEAFEVGDCDISIGIENGVFFSKTNEFAFVSDFAYVVIWDDRPFIANSAGHPVRHEDFQEAQSRGLDKHTVASVTRERTGCDATDATPHYTGGRMSRVELLKQAIKLALCQWLAAKDGVAP
jgi:non-canonical (house-cleaning) NTP pyrophosphatase